MNDFENDINKVIELISQKKEGPCVDFKRDFYSPLNKSDFPKDIAAFANVLSDVDKYIIFGVDDSTCEIVGVDLTSLPTQDNFDNYIDYILSPFVHIRSGIFEHDGKKIAFINVLSSNINPPYIIKQPCGKNDKIAKGDIFIRKGTCNQKVSREDLDNMYLHNQFHNGFVDCSFNLMLKSLANINVPGVGK